MLSIVIVNFSEEKSKLENLLSQNLSILIGLKGILNSILERMQLSSESIKNCHGLNEIREIDTSSLNQVIEKFK